MRASFVVIAALALTCGAANAHDHHDDGDHVQWWAHLYGTPVSQTGDYDDPPASPAQIAKAIEGQRKCNDVVITSDAGVTRHKALGCIK